MVKSEFSPYLLDIPEIDAEHWHLIETLNDLQYEIKRMDPGEAWLKSNIFYKLLYEHCFTEEKLMTRIGYPGAMIHAENHPETSMQLVNTQYHSTNILGLDVGRMILFFSEHITNTDRLFVPYYQKWLAASL